MTRRPLVPDLDDPFVPLGRWLDRQVELLQQAYEARDPVALWLVRGTGVLQGSDSDLWARGLTLELARQIVAKDRGYKDWADAAAHSEQLVDTAFERAADAIQWGDLDTLERLLDQRPDLVEQRSPFPHGAMLLHYVAANGVEVERQIQTPANAVQVMRLLLDRGAEPDATCTIYGDGQTTMCLLVSSAHPAAAHVQPSLVQELCRGGANPNGPKGDGMPLWTAITFGYRDAAEALVRCGARVDNLAFAAAVGDLDRVRSYFGADGKLKPDVGNNMERLAEQPGRPLDYAVIWAAGHDRREVVKFLLTKDPDLTVRDPTFGATAAGFADYLGNEEIVALLQTRAAR